ncbi:ImmA/IrrE family metallo-endopeptidase [Nocardia ignorata]|uniref:ImmA/IrrE family metallo-endopeptidase n=1 Tax=Nocardia ignorata TaxID=145285 RepID=UPI0035313B31
MRPVVALNPIKRDFYRQRFDVAHELGHLLMHSDAEPGGRIVENQANRFASELLMPADLIRGSLPTSMGGSAWRDLHQLKEYWGVSIQAMLYRARSLGVLSDMSYRNAMATISARGWRRVEPASIKVMEQPSLLPRAVELLGSEGISEKTLIEQSLVPAELFRTITARSPLPTMPGAPIPPNGSGAAGKVVSLFDVSLTSG